MIGVMSWLACGLLVGFIVSQLIAVREKGYVGLTLSVGCAGGLVGGMCAQIAAVGHGTAFSFYGLIFASVGAWLALLGYRRLVGV